MFLQQQNNLNKRDSIPSSSKDLQNENEVNDDDDLSGSGSGVDQTEEEINQSEDTIDQSESTTNPISQSEDSTRKNTITTDKLHLLQKINEHNNEQHMIAKKMEREKAVNFAKFFRDGTTGEVRDAQSKRNQIAIKPKHTFSSLRPQQTLPSVEEIFKRDRIQIHKNLEKLSAKYKDSNPLLKDLSKFTSDQAPNPIWKKFIHDAKSAVAITKRQNLLGYMFKSSATTPSNNNNNKPAMFVAGNHLYKKVLFYILLFVIQYILSRTIILSNY